MGKNGCKSEKTDAYASEYRLFRIRRKKHGNKYKLAWARKLDAHTKRTQHAESGWTQKNGTKS